MNNLNALLNPPFVSDERKLYYDSLSEITSKYIEYLHLSMFCDILSQEDYAKLEYIGKEIQSILKTYLSGQSGEAYKKLSDLLDSLSFNWDNMSYRIDHENAFIRIRSTSDNLRKRTDMFHVPFNKRQLISKQRYSIEGFPCLYLSGCAYTSWLELNRPEFSSIWASSFRPSKEMKLLDMAFTLNSLEINHTQYQQKHLKDLLCLYIFVIATSYRVKYPSAYFHEEYILSGLILQWITKNSTFVGLRYLSTKLNYYDHHKLWCASNIVMPPQNHIFGEEYNEFLRESFILSLPQHWNVLMSYSNAGSVSCLECGGDYFKEKTTYEPTDKDFSNNLDELIFKNYNATWFYNIDGYLRSIFKLDYIE